MHISAILSVAAGLGFVYATPKPAETEQVPAPPTPTVVGHWGQCGGQGLWANVYVCEEPYQCYINNPYFFNCYTVEEGGTRELAHPPPKSTTTVVKTTAYTTPKTTMKVTTTEATTAKPTTVKTTLETTPKPTTTPTKTIAVTTPPVTTLAVETPRLVPEYAQCGGQNFNGPTKCVPGTNCYVINPYFSNCYTPEYYTSRFPPPAATTSRIPTVTVPLWAQCGGIQYTGVTDCAPGTVCVASNPYWSQCLMP